MAFAQLTARESLRDLEASLRARRALLYQMGFRGRVVRSTLSDADKRKDWRSNADWAQTLIKRACKLYAAKPFALELDQTVYALDATVNDLCLGLFPWAHFTLGESGDQIAYPLGSARLHPNICHSGRGRSSRGQHLGRAAARSRSDLRDGPRLSGFARLGRFTQAGAFFVIRSKTNLKFYVVESRPVDPSNGLQCDQTIGLVTALNTAA